MKAKVFSLIIGLAFVGQMAFAQTTSYKMNVKMTDGSFFSVAADDVEEVYFTTTKVNHFEDTYYIVSGRAEKGPFKNGTTVTMQPLDLQLNALGTAQTSMTFDDCGNYSFRNLLFKYPYVSLKATGLFFNEYDDYKTKDTQLTLQSYADLQRGSKVNLNVVTHLIADRVANLVIGGMDFDDALTQAQGELLSIFGLHKYNDKDFTQVSITDGDDYAAALLAISVPLLYNRNGSELISWMTRLRYDFADDGKLTEQNKSTFDKDRNSISLNSVIKKLTSKYKEYGMDVTFKDLLYFYDWDNDGVVGNEIYEPSQPATCDLTNINAPMAGGIYSVHVNCNVPLYLSPLKLGGDYNMATPDEAPFISSYMSLFSVYENGTLTITVNPAQCRIVSDTKVNLYDAIGNVAVTVTISQEGNPEGEYLTVYGKNYVAAICQALASSHALYRIADAKYTGLIDNNDFRAPLEPYNYNINNLYRNYYQLIRYNYELVRRVSQQNANVLMPMFFLTNSLAYYELVVMFGGVPYINENQDVYYNIPRSSQEEILSKLVENLTSIIENLQDTKGGYISSADDMALPSKDLAHLVLADIYMYQGNYDAAKTLLAEIVNAGKYSLVAEQNGLGESNSEIIWSLPTSSSDNGVTRGLDNNASSTIIKTYADVLLSLAECESKLGNDPKAYEYLNQVKSAKSIETTSTEVIPAISEVRSKIQIDFGGYFAFLKRTGLAKSTLGLEDYQLLFPIPQDEIYNNPSMTQNPGYNGGTR